MNANSGNDALERILNALTLLNGATSTAAKQDTAQTTLTSINSKLPSGLAVGPNGLLVQPSTPALIATPLTTPSFAATVSTLLAPSNANRKGFTLWNNSANSIYITFAATSSSATPTFILATFQTLSFMFAYSGPIAGIRNAGTGSVTIWEFT